MHADQCVYNITLTYSVVDTNMTYSEGERESILLHILLCKRVADN